MSGVLVSRIIERIKAALTKYTHYGIIPPLNQGPFPPKADTPLAEAYLVERPGSHHCLIDSWAFSSFGRALPWHGRGDRFEPGKVHHLKIRVKNSRFFILANRLTTHTQPQKRLSSFQDHERCASVI